MSCPDASRIPEHKGIILHVTHRKASGRQFLNILNQKIDMILPAFRWMVPWLMRNMMRGTGGCSHNIC